ncbi:hypothetical protein ACJX0J_010006, partial [Zea mays]
YLSCIYCHFLQIERSGQNASPAINNGSFSCTDQQGIQYATTPLRFQRKGLAAHHLIFHMHRAHLHAPFRVFCFVIQHLHPRPDVFTYRAGNCWMELLIKGVYMDIVIVISVICINHYKLQIMIIVELINMDVLNSLELGNMLQALLQMWLFHANIW